MTDDRMVMTDPDYHRGAAHQSGREGVAQPTIPATVGVVGKGMINNNALLGNVLTADIKRWYPWSRLTLSSVKPEAFIGWGRKRSFQRAAKAARRSRVPVLSIEDGFLRSLDSGMSSKFGMSVVVDDLGIYFDSSATSRLEQLILDSTLNGTPVQAQYVQAMMSKLCDNKLSKYNSTTYCPQLDLLSSAVTRPTLKKTAITTKKSPVEHILLIDQIQGDASITGAGASARQFKKMLKVACQRHPKATIWIKTHPAGKKGYLTALKLPNHVRILTESLNPIALLRQVSHVYTVSSHMGFEALMLGKSVHCFGVNWYSGWGLTDDSYTPKRRLKKVQKRRLKSYQLSVKAHTKRPKLKAVKKVTATVEQLFYASYLQYSRYVDPATAQPCDLNTAMTWLITNRHWQDELSGPLTIFEFSRWKLPFVKDFVNFPQSQLFIKPKPRLKNLLHPDHFRMDDKTPALVWGLAKRQQLQKRLQNKGVTEPRLYCMEDGFIRSNGLGATLLAPLSVVIDKCGIYYDATRPSDLEQLLVDCPDLTTELQARVQALWQQLLTQRVSKYNVGQAGKSELIKANKASGKRRLLIVGQVEDDLSVQYCGSLVKTNSALITRVRQDHPDAYLVYKPHPDVEAGLRTGKVDEMTLKLVDSVAHGAAMPDCLEAVDEVHTISSLTGFEALLRGLDVVCYGLPFYAGWGLTRDIDAALVPKSDFLKRRRRDNSLTLEQLIYCTLIQYPLYRLPNGYGLAQPEQVINYLYPNNNLSKKKSTKDSAIADSTSSSVIATFIKSVKRRASIRFMQQRHRWLQRH